MIHSTFIPDRSHCRAGKSRISLGPETIEMRLLISLIALLWVLTCSLGCVVTHRPAYPLTWPRAATNQARESFHGVFASQILNIIDGNFNQSDTLVAGKIALSVNTQNLFSVDTLRGYPDKPPSFVEYPTVNSTYKTRILKKQKGILITYRPREILAGNMIFGFNRSYNLFSMLEDGSLLVKSGAWNLGLVVMIIPFYGSDYSWIRVSQDSVRIVGEVTKK